MTLHIGRHNPCAYALFSDRTGEVCIISEGLMNRGPVLMLGYQHHKMMLSTGQVRQILPLLERFACTGQMITPLEPEMDFVI